MNAEITAVEVQILTSQSALTREESTVEAQKEELNVLQPFAESKIAALNPTFVPTATEVTKSIFRLSSCPVCSFGFHCMNFMPAPCGHAYHPACLVALVAKDGLKCIQCQESFHPHWCESWGINNTEEYRQEWEHNTELQKQRDAFTTKVRDASPSSTIISSREEEKDCDLCLTEVNHVPLTRSKSGNEELLRRQISQGRCGPGTEYFDASIWVFILMAGDSQTKFLGTLHISKCWGPSEGHLTYAGCGRLLRDGSPCGLGLRARKTREIAGSSSNTQIGATASITSSQFITPVGKTPDRVGHTCVESGEHTHLFHFFVETVEPRYIVEVWDRAGQEIFRMTGQEFFDKYGNDILLLHQFVSSHLAGTPWAITVIGYPSVGEYFCALSFSRAGGKSPKSEMVIGTPSSRVGFLLIPAVPVRPEAVDTNGTLSSVGSSSLGILMRMKTRVDSLGKDTAEAIAVVKLEQEEEFVDSAPNWAQ
ncbi:hypothetical protein R1sor_025553 [Riccia sorocarpa]|uniref:RING-type domain-containing protein n=1 Tax=Riccia sorocarpa TaxID=122646 RepID=A0ABD3GBZ4_9MARC